MRFIGILDFKTYRKHYIAVQIHIVRASLNIGKLRRYAFHKKIPVIGDLAKIWQIVQKIREIKVS